jgi:hypothetical protein
MTQFQAKQTRKLTALGKELVDEYNKVLGASGPYANSAFPTFLLQSGGPLPNEKIACSFSSHPVRYCSYEGIEKLDPETSLTHYVPVGSVEFVKAYSQHVGIKLPGDFSYGVYSNQLAKFLMRSIRKGTYGDATLDEFVKPVAIKSFTGNLKATLKLEIGDHIQSDTPVWISPAVEFRAEFRFYIQGLIGGDKIVGWARYDDSDAYEEDNPEPDFGLVEEIMVKVQDTGLGAYTIDIGWRPDLDCYCLVELNDAWALGFYENMDRQSNPPTRQQYADMLVSRWRQLIFCNLTDKALKANNNPEEGLAIMKQYPAINNPWKS